MKVLSQAELIQSVQNSVHYLEDEDGYLSFLRFSARQLQVYEPNPLYRLMSRCSSGIYLAFETNGDSFAFDCKTDDFNPKKLVEITGEMTFSQILQQLGETVKKVSQAGSRLDIFQHFDLYINDAYTCSARLSQGRLNFAFPNPERKWLKIKLFLPLYKPLYIRQLTLSGKWRCRAKTRPLLYAFGDSITQGFIAGKPSLCYLSQLAELLEVNALNQAVGGAMFDPDNLSDLENLPVPDLVLVAYGTNDWQNGSSYEQVRQQAEAFFERLRSLYARVPTYVLTPIWRDDHDKTTETGRLTDIVRMIRDTAGALPSVRLIDGLRISAHNPACYSDGYLHPNIMGFSYMAPRLYRTMQDWKKFAGRLA